ncbi:TlpA disulfide reductase family protein [Aeromicrobium alkaliterrae]|uniref:TlpA disulfide reductase family protein n=1 Tax=Aeromicrobium alkaliterrae TaxID=302168 RepID=A0ABN2JNV0_9ACTN
MSPPRCITALVLGVALTASIAACSGSAPSDVAEGGYVSGDGSITVVAPSERDPAPVLEGTDLDGAPLSTAQFEGQVLVVNIWGSWCPPCRKETPDLVVLADELAGEGVQLVGIAIREGRTASKAFATNVGMSYPSFSDPGGEMLIGFSTSLPAVAVPTTYVIDAEGRVAVRYMDQVDPDTLRELISDVQDGR